MKTFNDYIESRGYGDDLRSIAGELGDTGRQLANKVGMKAVDVIDNPQKNIGNLLRRGKQFASKVGEKAVSALDYLGPK